ncbi:hypothetical protein I302_103222 [Kwoniella bestiolae CBS 10118]|uniref:Ig-like domain-containing protein n=1 Tax=Kwoniella bestiolae CBS 10118 TaxID=1296100 RepID=A0A1B9G7T8_9TREE|nr:hypothetical protein I302_01921 [Kwoniella bestiolae CBS 10118]OCF27086.1 hypothetical protein I302_01921 [Kwoniella bestiolae CBS 10118]
MIRIVLLTCLSVLTRTQAQSTVSSSSGLTYQCPTDPSAIVAFSHDLCPTTYTSASSGNVWPQTGSTVVATYSKAPTGYYSTATTDLSVTCVYQDPNAAVNSYGCRYLAGAATGTDFAAGTVQQAGGEGLRSGQKCPSLLVQRKPQPSPGLQYKKRLNTATSFACATIQTDGSNYLSAVSYGASSTGQNYQCTYKSGSSTFRCRYDTDGTLIPISTGTTPNAGCPLTQCSNVQPYTRRRRGLPQAADRRQTSREQIIARQKEISERFA